ncbi:hypothetical protein BV22DRAFT_1131497 [Leucogyrophana mollusca]|uniref:Uncharacterized protein n=1 Tax=Leucogyrophana mollusca TaxID=85980 RepID=A0ACB8BA94_9AGAM|nr:hypothetical protein BV22DRAFT_1131497 [Leucogyrophana mollusca]
MPFANLSDVSSALPDLESLLRKWKSGAICWEAVSDEEFKRLHTKRNERIEKGEIEDPCRRTRADKGKHHKRARVPDADEENRGTRCQGQKRAKVTAYKSAATIDSSDENEEEPAGVPGSTTSAVTPAPTVPAAEVQHAPASTIDPAHLFSKNNGDLSSQYSAPSIINSTGTAFNILWGTGVHGPANGPLMYPDYDPAGLIGFDNGNTSLGSTVHPHANIHEPAVPDFITFNFDGTLANLDTLGGATDNSTAANDLSFSFSM